MNLSAQEIRNPKEYAYYALKSINKCKKSYLLFHEKYILQKNNEAIGESL